MSLHGVSSIILWYFDLCHHHRHHIIIKHFYVRKCHSRVLTERLTQNSLTCFKIYFVLFTKCRVATIVEIFLTIALSFLNAFETFSVFCSSYVSNF
jgi:hypothetical protein